MTHSFVTLTRAKLATAMFLCMFCGIGAGVLGGALYVHFHASASDAADDTRLMRTTGIELIDRAGKRIGLLGPSGGGDLGLVFYDQLGKSRAEFGLSGGSEPFFHINDPRGGPLLTLALGQSGKPMMVMSDSDFNGRVLLGIAEPDAPIDKRDYTAWVLEFRGDRRNLAVIGMRTNTNGGVTVCDRAGNEWRTPIQPTMR